MRSIVVADQEIRAGLRNRWVIGATLLLAMLSLSLVLLGSSPTGEVGADPLAVVLVSLTSLTIFLVPLIALLLSFDSIVGERERGTLALLLSYPVSRWEVILGKFLGQSAIIAIATTLGYGAAALTIAISNESDKASWLGFAGMIGSSILLGSTFVAIGGLCSVLVRERGTAAGLALGVWMLFVILYDTVLLGVLVADQGRIVTEGILKLLLLISPTDTYRLLNMTATEGASVYSGMAGLGSESQMAPALLLASLVTSMVLPLAMTVAIFRKKEI